MTSKERLEFLVKRNGTQVGDSYLCDVKSALFFTFDDGSRWDVRSVDIDISGNIGVMFHESERKYLLEEFSEDEVCQLMLCISQREN